MFRTHENNAKGVCFHEFTSNFHRPAPWAPERPWRGPLPPEWHQQLPFWRVRPLFLNGAAGVNVQKWYAKTALGALQPFSESQGCGFRSATLQPPRFGIYSFLNAAPGMLFVDNITLVSLVEQCPNVANIHFAWGAKRAR